MRAFRIAYDGRDYHGFQRQPDVRTVEGTIFEALQRLDALSGNKPANYSAAGRTDAGVSAIAQTVAFEAPEWMTPKALTAVLPPDILVWASAEVLPTFHATHDADERTYSYRLPSRGRDISLLEMALRELSGTHDYHNLTPDSKGTVRTVHLDLVERDDWLVITATAGGFPRQLIRRIISVCDNIATETLPLERIDQLLSNDQIPGHLNVGPADPEPLLLEEVRYEGVTFAHDPEATLNRLGAFERSSDRAVAAGLTLAEVYRGIPQVDQKNKDPAGDEDAWG